MRQAIVTGATGYVGSAVVNDLLQNGIDVLAIGRKPIDTVSRLSGKKTGCLAYIQLDSSRISELPKLIKSVSWNVSNSCVFYNFAWSGLHSLTDGKIEDQLRNATYVASAVASAKILGCKRFVNAGTMEETFLEQHLKCNWHKTHYHSGQDFYALSKLSARDLCKLTAYLEKIEYVHTRFSVFIDERLCGTGYIPRTLMKIAEGDSYETPKNDQLFDILPIKDGAKAYRLIGAKGLNKADYFIGTGEPSTLQSYFSRFKRLVNDDPAPDEVISPAESSSQLICNAFSISRLMADTGFRPSLSFSDFAKQLLGK